ncbi:LacI family DNA-binding transcriptional regulator [Lysobacter korlensis]|uniref:LacI family DNA-binding transcriptional regulator n=1 Tax=Lysobacter korlensis TaxID=553636 RepID=A0ABV6RP58_9GAMM
MTQQDFPASPPPTMADVATRAGVALGTVSNVLNAPEKVAEATRARVQRAIDELGFVPNRAARVLAAGTSTTIGFVIVDLANSFFLDMARGAEREAERQGMNVLIGDSDLRIEKQRTYLRLFDEERAAGVLVAPHPDTDEDVDRARARGRRIVVVNGHSGLAGCSVDADNELGGYLAARHLIETGRRRLLFVGSRTGVPALEDRARGARRAVAETNGAVVLSLRETSRVRAEHGREVGRELATVSAGRRPDGIVAASDLLAVGIIEVLLASGVSVPAEVGVVGYDDNRAAWDSALPISTVAQPGTEMGIAATRLLLEELRSPQTHRHRHIVLEPRLVPRESSAPANRHPR